MIIKIFCSSHHQSSHEEDDKFIFDFHKVFPLYTGSYAEFYKLHCLDLLWENGFEIFYF